MQRFLAAAVLAACSLLSAQASEICTVVADASDGRVLLERGDCRTRYTPASTFKIPLALIGFDSGVLFDEHSPVFGFEQGDPDWGGAPWRQPTEPTRWLKYSVVWYSQRITYALGEERVHDYAERLGFGNADFSGDPGLHNGLERAWIMSSLKVSPLEQTVFLRRLVNDQLPVSQHAMDLTRRIVETFQSADGAAVQGKTGSAFPRRPDRSFDESRAYGWFVGWTLGAGRRLVFARLDQDDGVLLPGSSGLRARDAFLRELPALTRALPRP